MVKEKMEKCEKCEGDGSITELICVSCKTEIDIEGHDIVIGTDDGYMCYNCCSGSIQGGIMMYGINEAWEAAMDDTLNKECKECDGKGEVKGEDQNPP